MSYTRRDLVDQALRNLGVLPASATPSAADVATVDAKVDAIVDELSTLDIVTISDIEEIEPRYFFSLAVCLADVCKNEFGGSQVDRAAAEMQLRRLNYVGPDYSVKSVDYF